MPFPSTANDVLVVLVTTKVWGNLLVDYILFLGHFATLLILFYLLQLIFVQRLEKLVARTKTDIDDIVIRVVKTVKPPFYSFLAFYLALRVLQVDEFAQRIVHILLVSSIAFQVVLALQVAIDSVFQKRLHKEQHPGHTSVLEVLRGVARFVLWVIGFLFILSNLGVNITSLVAGLGIGGIAIALATQNILADLFSSLVIYFDQPFAPGDFIEIGQDLGTVQKIGVKTTRIRSLRGEEIIIPNKDIAAARVKNFKRLTERRVEFTFGVPYELSARVLRSVPDLIEEVIAGVPHTRFERAHLHRIEDTEPQFIVVYFVDQPAYESYMDAHQAILLGIKETFDRAKIRMM